MIVVVFCFHEQCKHLYTPSEMREEHLVLCIIQRCAPAYNRVENKRSPDKHNIGALLIQQAFELIKVEVHGPLIPEYVAILLPALLLGGGLLRGWVGHSKSNGHETGRSTG